MKIHLFNFVNRKLLMPLALIVSVFCGLSFGQSVSEFKTAETALQSSLDSVVTIYSVAGGQGTPIGSGLVVGAKGYILVPFHLIKDKQELRVKLRNGEIFDNAQVVAKDERRNVALIHVLATGLKVIPNGTVDESNVGGNLSVVSSPAGAVSINKNNLLTGIQLADSVPGAGSGYRILLFDAKTADNQIGGLLLNENGNSIGIVTTNPEVKSQNIAVPFSSILGLIQSVLPETVVAANAPKSDSTTAKPFPIPQSSVEVPQRGVSPLDPKGPGSVVVSKPSATEVLKTAKTVYVESDTTFFKSEQLVTALLKRNEFTEWGLIFVADRDVADLILEVDHLLFTYKFTFSLHSQRQGVIVASGGVIIFDGNLGAGTMAKHIVKQLKKVRGEDVKPAAKENKTEVKSKTR